MNTRDELNHIASFIKNFKPISTRITDLRKDKIYSKKFLSKNYRLNKQRMLNNENGENEQKKIISPITFKSQTKRMIEPTFVDESLYPSDNNQMTTHNIPETSSSPITSSNLTSDKSSLDPSVSHKFNFKKTKSHIKTPYKSKKSRASMKSTTIKSYAGNDFQQRTELLSRLLIDFDLDNSEDDDDPYTKSIIDKRENVNLSEIINIPENIRKEAENMCNKKINLRRNNIYFNEDKDDYNDEEDKINLTF